MTCCLWTLVLAAAAVGAAAAPPAGPIEVPSMLIKPIEQVDVPAREPGALADVQAREGLMVEQGAVLAQIEDAEARTAEQRAKNECEIARLNAANDVNIRFARKSVEVARAELRRSEESNARYSKSVSASEMDRQRLLVEKSTLEIEQAKHEFDVAACTQKVKQADYLAAQQKVERHRVVAPLAGIVVQVNRRKGEWVKPGDSVLRILRIDRLRAEGYLKAQHLDQDLQGRSVRLVVDLPQSPGAVFPGKIVFVDPEIDPVNAQVRVWAEVENPGLRLRPGMRAKMLLDGPSKP